MAEMNHIGKGKYDIIPENALSTSSLCSLQTGELPMQQHDQELTQAFGRIMEKTQKPMSAAQQHIYKYVIGIDQQLENLTEESKQVIEMKDAEINQLKTEKAKAHELLGQTYIELNEQLSIVATLMRDVEDLQTKLDDEIRNSINKQNDASEMHQRDIIKEQENQLQMFENMKKQMQEEISNLEKAVRDAKAQNERLTLQLKCAEQEKAIISGQLDIQIHEHVHIQKELNERIRGLQERAENSEKMLDEISDHHVDWCKKVIEISKLLDLVKKNAEPQVFAIILEAAPVEAPMDAGHLTRKRQAGGNNDANGQIAGKRGRSGMHDEGTTAEQGGIRNRQEPQPGTSRSGYYAASNETHAASASASAGKIHQVSQVDSTSQVNGETWEWEDETGN